jgi:hypothetical protein
MFLLMPAAASAALPARDGQCTVAVVCVRGEWGIVSVWI